ncbi:MAG: hypothetical protein AABX59_01810 [Nanoarchaeota archaeon]
MQRDTKIGVIILVLAILALGFVLYMNVYEPLAFLDNPLVGEGLGTLCVSEEKCIDFCHNNKGRCDAYCRENPSNELCDILFGGRK